MSGFLVFNFDYILFNFLIILSLYTSNEKHSVPYRVMALAMDDDLLSGGRISVSLPNHTKEADEPLRVMFEATNTHTGTLKIFERSHFVQDGVADFLKLTSSHLDRVWAHSTTWNGGV